MIYQSITRSKSSHTILHLSDLKARWNMVNMETDEEIVREKSGILTRFFGRGIGRTGWKKPKK
jgi:hypothetical protein